MEEKRQQSHFCCFEHTVYNHFDGPRTNDSAIIVLRPAVMMRSNRTV